MTRQRNLGPILAAAGAVLALGAIVAGFIITGGPGDARDRRLDKMTMDHATTILNVAQCAHDETGIAPRTLEEAGETVIEDKTNESWPTCALGLGMEDIKELASSGVPPLGAASYEATSDNHIRICANFRRPSHLSRRVNCYDRLGYAEFIEPRSAGVHCFDIELIKGNGDAPSCASPSVRPAIHR